MEDRRQLRITNARSDASVHPPTISPTSPHAPKTGKDGDELGEETLKVWMQDWANFVVDWTIRFVRTCSTFLLSCQFLQPELNLRFFSSFLDHLYISLVSSSFASFQFILVDASIYPFFFHIRPILSLMQMRPLPLITDRWSCIPGNHHLSLL
jgi:hypothetical protein